MIHDEHEQSQNEDQTYYDVDPKVTKCVGYIDSLVGFAKSYIKEALTKLHPDDGRSKKSWEEQIFCCRIILYFVFFVSCEIAEISMALSFCFLHNCDFWILISQLKDF